MDGARVTDVRRLTLTQARPRLNVRAGAVLWATYGLMGVLLAGYLSSLIVQGDHPWAIFNDWAAAGYEVAGSVLCLVRGFARRPGRAVALTLGFGLLMWAIGDLVLTAASQGGAEPATPSLADVFYLGFFPLTYVAVLIFMRGEIRKLATPNWLDGAVA